MSRLFIKQKVFSVGEKFTVFDELQQSRYFVRGSFMQIPKRFTVTTASDVPVAQITKTVFSFLPRFTVEMEGVGLVATIRKEFTFFKPKYSVDGAALSVSGDWWDMNFSVFRANHEVARIHRKLLSWGDTYEVDVFDDALEAMIISLVVAIDRVRADASSSSSAASWS
ncbi:LURP-one-related/scramblase family protein [Gordonia sputi]|uniref:LURP-one-related/scramblase family protein n=1 Tax=Gordonia sputi TaxID=36823 RepID=UPI002044A0A6|nr:LURP-one-related family protein [Gordonia sputi]MCM3897658.1 LURP-one-related family protein [Gordonia sputi]